MKMTNGAKPVGIEVSLAVAEAVKLAGAEVIAAYPITPQTHIVEHLSDLVANGELNAEYIPVESEHSAMSASLGASATGARTFTATSSQGLLLMSEIVFVAPLMRLPVVMVVANRAITGPINIWNDHSDIMSVRDSGWIQLFAENGQEATDMSIIAFRIAEDKNVMLPLILNIDGFTLSHFIEPIVFPEQDAVRKYLPAYKTEHKLDLNKPISFGLMGPPDIYTEARKAVDDALVNAKDYVTKAFDEFGAIFDRHYSIVESYQTEDAETIIVTMGSIAETAMAAVDEMRASGEKVGLVRLRLWRPFPVNEFLAAVKKAKNLAVVDRHMSMGFPKGLVAMEIETLLAQDVDSPKVFNFVLGLGGRDITRDHFKYIVEQSRELSVAGRQEHYELVGVLA